MICDLADIRAFSKVLDWAAIDRGVDGNASETINNREPSELLANFLLPSEFEGDSGSCLEIGESFIGQNQTSWLLLEDHTLQFRVATEDGAVDIRALHQDAILRE